LLALVVLATTMFIKKSRLYNFVIVKGQDGVWHFR